jgi:hypothetical protein
LFSRPVIAWVRLVPRYILSTFGFEPVFPRELELSRVTFIAQRERIEGNLAFLREKLARLILRDKAVQERTGKIGFVAMS